ncbi:hypothetical protein ACHAXM_002503 [Skeletonema potamos]
MMASFISSSRLVQDDITALAKKSVIRVGGGCSSVADDENKNFEILAAVLRKTSALETLQLDETAAVLKSNEFVTALARNRTIRFLNLRSSGCDDDGAKALAAILKENSTLQTMSSNNNNICDVGAEALADALKENGSVQKIYLNDNNISDEGAKALANALRGNDGSLQLISLRRNKLTNEGAKEFTEALEASKTRQRMNIDWGVGWGVVGEGRETELTEKTPKINSTVYNVESVESDQINDEGERATVDTNMLDRHQMEMDKFLAERKLMMQQLDNLSTARHEARDELAAKDAMLKMKDEKLLAQRKQLDDYQKVMNKATIEQQIMRQKLGDKLFVEKALAASQAAAKDAELITKSEEILNLRKQLDQTEAAKVLAESEAAKINAELRISNDLIKTKDAELWHLHNGLSIQRNELANWFRVGQQQSKQLLDNLSANMARAKSREASKDADLRMLNDLLKTKDEELLNQRKKLDALEKDLKQKDDDILVQKYKLQTEAACDQNLRERAKETEQRVEQLSAENTHYIATIASLQKNNDELSAQVSQLSNQVNSLNEKLKYTKVIDLVDLTTAIEKGTSNSREASQVEELPSKRRRITSNDVNLPTQNVEVEADQNYATADTATTVEATRQSPETMFEEALEKHKAETFKLLAQAKARGEDRVSDVAIGEVRNNTVDAMRRENPLISWQEMMEALSRAENHARQSYILENK